MRRWLRWLLFYSPASRADCLHEPMCQCRFMWSVLMDARDVADGLRSLRQSLASAPISLGAADSRSRCCAFRGSKIAVSMSFHQPVDPAGLAIVTAVTMMPMTSRISRPCLAGWPATKGSAGGPPLKKSRCLTCLMRPRSPARSRQHRAGGCTFTFGQSGHGVQHWQCTDTGLAVAPASSGPEQTCSKTGSAVLAASA